MYTNFYSLRADPFRMSPDHSFCFRHASFSKAKAYMQYALHREEGFVLITGGPGTGKTTLIGDLLSDYNQTDFDIAKLTGAKLEGDDLLRMVSHAFRVSVSGTTKSETLNHLHRYLTDIYKRKRRPLLIIDEAQGLTPAAMEELRLLTNLQIDGQPLLQIFLIGQSELRDLVLDPTLEQLHQRIVAACHLEPLKTLETASYVMHRLKCTGWSGSPMINIEIFPELFNFSRGIPRRINLAFSRLLLHGSLEEKNWLDATDIRLVVKELREEDLFPGDPSAVVELHDFDVAELLSLVQPSKPKTVSKISDSEIHHQNSLNDLDSRKEETTSVPHVGLANPSNADLGMEGHEAASVNTDDKNREASSVFPLVDEVDYKKTAAESQATHSTDKVLHPQLSKIVDDDTNSQANAIESIIYPLTSNSRRQCYRRYARWSIAISFAIGLVMVVATLLPLSTHPLSKGITDASWVQLGIDKVHNLASGLSGYNLSIQSENEPQRSFVSDLEIPATILEKLGTEHRTVFKVLAKTVTESDPDQSGSEDNESVTKMATPTENSVPKKPGPKFEKTIPAKDSQPPVEQQIAAGEKIISPYNDGLGALRQRQKTLLEGHSYTTFGEVIFQFDSAEIDTEYRVMLDALVETLISSEEHVAHIFGYTDNVGDPLYNVKLSERRANSVARYFMDKGVKRNHLLVEGRGTKSDVSKEGLHKQRTVSIYIELKKATRDFLSYK